MTSTPQKIMSFAEGLEEGSPLCPAALLQFGSRASIDQALSRLARSGRLLRICQGVYMRPIKTRFGSCAPSIHKAINELSRLWGEPIVPSGGSAANRLGLTTQNPVREVHLTAGPNRYLNFYGFTVELRHAPRWQLLAPNLKAGDLIRALAWLGPNEIDDSLNAVWPTLTDEDLKELNAATAVLPQWIAEPISRRISLHRQ